VDPGLSAQNRTRAYRPSGVDVLVPDEANLTDDRDRAALYQAAGRSGTKLVEVGDPQQLRGVGCGSLFSRVHELVGGMELTENRRQAEQDERAAIAAWRDGRYTQALASWAGRGRLVATETGEQAVTAMVTSTAGSRLRRRGHDSSNAVGNFCCQRPGFGMNTAGPSAASSRRHHHRRSCRLPAVP